MTGLVPRARRLSRRVWGAVCAAAMLASVMTVMPTTAFADDGDATYSASASDGARSYLQLVDVTASTPHVEDIRWLVKSGISTGWRCYVCTSYEAEFRSTNPVTRQDMAAFLYRVAGSPSFDAGKVRNPFTDVNAQTPHYKEILWLAHSGVSVGWKTPRGVEFRGMDSVKRQDMAAFLHRLADYRKAKPSLGKAVSFRDVSKSTPHQVDIIWLARTGVTTGWRDGTFRGMNEVIRQDMAAFLHRLKTNVLDDASDGGVGKPGDAKPAISAKIREAGDGWAIDRDGYLWTWGNNRYGQVGDDTMDSRLTPYKVQGPRDVKTFDSNGSFRYAVTADGELWTWGDNSTCMVGNDCKRDIGTDSWLTPYKVPLPLAVKEVTVHFDAIYAVTSDGRLWAWGDNTLGQLGDPSVGLRAVVPHQVPGLSDVHLLDSYSLTMMVTTGDGSLWAWGYGATGTVGDGHSGWPDETEPYHRDTPYRVPGPTHVRQIVTSELGDSVYAIAGDGSLWAWGNNYFGEIGDGTIQGDEDGPRVTPYKVQGPKNVRSVTVAGNIPITVLAVDGEGAVWTWGSNDYGQIGRGDSGVDGSLKNQLTPYKVSGPTNVKSASVDSWRTAYAVDGAGDLWLWGRSSERLASGSGEPYGSTPLKVPNLHGVTSVATREGLVSVTTQDGALWRWGNGGLVGDGSTKERPTPYRLNGLSGVTANIVGASEAVNIGTLVSYAITGDGGLWTWGPNPSGQIGDGSTKDRLTPYRVSGPTKVRRVFFHYPRAQPATVYALTEDGDLWSWGANKEGFVGDGTTTNRLAPYRLQFK